MKIRYQFAARARVAAFLIIFAAFCAEQTLFANEPSPCAFATANDEPPIATPAAPAEEATSAAPVNEIWMAGRTANGLYFWFFTGKSWERRTLDDFLAGQDERPTVVWAHGYQTDMTRASEETFEFKRTLDAAQKLAPSSTGYRLVAWKWASERGFGPLRADASEKAALADAEGASLARLLDAIDPAANVSLVGFSFGARVVGSALAATTVERTGRSTLTLLSAACDYGAFGARGRYGAAAKKVDEVLNAYNPADFALRHYPFASETGSTAQGTAPISATVFPGVKTVNYDVSRVLRARHSFDEIVGLPGAEAWRRMIF
ncbi:MAG: hypothetical protein HUK22_01575 [Thermoguttaceae bacterium]|nr:hypothetical protein [Thermoguttaceae bacterium]